MMPCGRSPKMRLMCRHTRCNTRVKLVNFQVKSPRSSMTTSPILPEIGMGSPFNFSSSPPALPIRMLCPTDASTSRNLASSLHHSLQHSSTRTTKTTKPCLSKWATILPTLRLKIHVLQKLLQLITQKHLTSAPCYRNQGMPIVNIDNSYCQMWQYYVCCVK